MVGSAEVAKNVEPVADWDSLAKGPEMVAEEPVKDAEYYRKNPKKVSELASRLIDLRGGLDAPEGRMDVKLGILVDEAGFPTDWLELTKYLRENPSEIDRAYAECERLDGAEATVAESDSEEEPTATVEEKSKVAESKEVEDEEKDVWGSGSLVIPGFEKMSGEEAIDMLAVCQDGVVDHPTGISFSDKLASALKRCSPAARTMIEYNRSKRYIDRMKKANEERKKRLKEISPVLPWSKHAKEADTLRTLIASDEKHIELEESELGLIMATMPDNITEDDKRVIEKVRVIDEIDYQKLLERNVRDLARDIKRISGVIKKQEKWIADVNAGLIKEAPAVLASRKADVESDRKKVAELQKQIDAYLKDHPDFILDVDEAKKAAAKKIKARMAEAKA